MTFMNEIETGDEPAAPQPPIEGLPRGAGVILIDDGEAGRIVERCAVSRTDLRPSSYVVETAYGCELWSVEDMLALGPYVHLTLDASVRSSARELYSAHRRDAHELIELLKYHLDELDELHRRAPDDYSMCGTITRVRASLSHLIENVGGPNLITIERELLAQRQPPSAAS